MLLVENVGRIMAVGWTLGSPQRAEAGRDGRPHLAGSFRGQGEMRRKGGREFKDLQGLWKARRRLSSGFSRNGKTKP